MQFGVHYSYLRDADNNPAVCVAILTTPNSKTVSFQIATRNPKDNFVKKYARAAAGGRLVKRPVIIEMPEVDSKQTVILDAIVMHLLKTDFEDVSAGPITVGVVEQFAYYNKLY